jgi:rod shape-determining protein MreD
VRLPLYALAVSGGTLVQSTLAPLLGVGGVVPDVPVVLVVLMGLRQGPEVGCLLGFALGLAEDVVAGGPLGLHALSKALLGFVAGALPRWFLVGKPVVAIVATALATVADGTVRFALLQLFQYPAPFSELFARVILPQAGYNAALVSLAVLVPVPRGRP